MSYQWKRYQKFTCVYNIGLPWMIARTCLFSLSRILFFKLHWNAKVEASADNNNGTYTINRFKWSLQCKGLAGMKRWPTERHVSYVKVTKISISKMTYLPIYSFCRYLSYYRLLYLIWYCYCQPIDVRIGNCRHLDVAENGLLHDFN